MELVKNENDVRNLTKNQVIGNPSLDNSMIKFNGENNVLFCENGVKLINSKLNFQGNDSVIYLSFSSKTPYIINLNVFNDSTVFFGKNNEINNLNVNIQESQNMIVGDDCIIGPDVSIRTSDVFPVFNAESKRRINFSGSIFIGDHVWLPHLTYISRGVNIGSGAIFSPYSFVPPNFTAKSNCYYMGNPAKLISRDVFFTDSHVIKYTKNETLESSNYYSDVYIFDVIENETLSLNYIDNILHEFLPIQRIEFLKKLLNLGRRQNRFSIH